LKHTAQMEDGIKTGCGNVDWTELAQDMTQKRASVNKVMNLQLLKNRKFIS